MMAVLRASEKNRPELNELLDPAAAERLKSERTFTLVEYGSSRSVEGVLQFTVNGEKAPCGELLYLYVRPEYRDNGVAAQLLMAMEETLSRCGVETAEVLLPESVGGIGDYLEDYGFLFEKETGSLFTFRDFTARNELLKKAGKNVKMLKDLVRREKADLIRKLKETGGERLFEDGFDEEESCSYNDPEHGDGILLLKKTEGFPVLKMLSAEGIKEEMIRKLLACYAILRLQRMLPAGSALYVEKEEDASFLREQFADYLREEKTFRGMLMVEEPERMSYPDPEEESYRGDMEFEDEDYVDPRSYSMEELLSIVKEKEPETEEDTDPE